jgi:hypothetical protein
MNHSEQVAKKIIERVRPGCNMTFRVHQSNGECDFELFHNHTLFALDRTGGESLSNLAPGDNGQQEDRQRDDERSSSKPSCSRVQG